MSRKMKIKFNLDKIKFSYIQPNGLFEELSQYNVNKYLDYEDFTLHIIDNGRIEGSEKNPTKLLTNVILADGTLLGTFTFNNSAKYDGLCFFKFANSALYKCEGYNYDGKYNCQTYISYVADALNLKLNSFTEIELAIDVNYNPIPRIRKLIKDHEHYEMIYNGKRIIDEERKIDNYGEFYSRSRRKIDRTPTLYFSQRKSDGLHAKIYDKTKEIEEESLAKTYVEEWNDFNRQNIYRIELTISWEQFKKWLQHINSPDSPFPCEWKQFLSVGEGDNISPSENDKEYLEHSQYFLLLESYRCQLWQFCADRLMYFRNRKTNEIVSLLDIALGWKPQKSL